MDTPKAPLIGHWGERTRDHQSNRYSQLMAAPTVSRPLTAALTHEGKWYVARCLEVEVASQIPSRTGQPLPLVISADLAPTEKRLHAACYP